MSIIPFESREVREKRKADEKRQQQKVVNWRKGQVVAYIDSDKNLGWCTKQARPEPDKFAKMPQFLKDLYDPPHKD